MTDWVTYYSFYAVNTDGVENAWYFGQGEDVYWSHGLALNFIIRKNIIYFKFSLLVKRSPRKPSDTHWKCYGSFSWYTSINPHEVDGDPNLHTCGGYNCISFIPNSFI